MYCSSQNPLTRPLVVTLLGAGLLLVGCGDLIPPRPPIGGPDEPAKQQPIEDQPTFAASTDGDVDQTERSFEGSWTTWQVYRFGTQIVGAAHTRAESVIDSDLLDVGAQKVRYLRRERMVFRSGRTSFSRRLESTSLESPDGKLIEFSTRSMAGPVVSAVGGTTRQQQLLISASSAGESSKQRLAWQDSMRGLFAVEQTLRRRPMVAKEKRRLEVLLPSLDAAGVIELQHRGPASVAMIDGNYRTLNEIDALTYRDTEVIDSLVLWIDDAGVIQKTLRPELRLESFNSDRESAEPVLDADDGDAVTVSLSGAIPRGVQPQQIAYVVVASELAARDLEESADSDAGRFAELMLPPVGNQTIRPVADGLQVLLSNSNAVPNGFESGTSEVRETDRTSTPWMDTENFIVKGYAGELDGLLPTEQVEGIAKKIRDQLTLTTQGDLQKASLTLRTRKGGRIDHAIAIAALLRHHQIPARLVIGLVPNEVDVDRERDLTRMSLTALVAVHLQSRWIMVDPRRPGFDRVDQIYLRVVDGQSKLRSELANVFRRISDIEIEIRGVK